MPTIVSSSRRLTRPALVAAALTLLAMLAVLLGPTGVLSPPPASASKTKIVAFADANRTVVCQLLENKDEFVNNLRCDLLKGKTRPALPPQPESCDFVWYPIVSMSTGSWRIAHWGQCVSDAIGTPPQRRPGEVVKVGAIRCKVLDPGVKCANTELKYGFKLTNKGMKWTRPKAKAKLSPEGIAALRLGMNREEAAATGQTGQAVCGSPQLNPDLKMRAYLGWRDNRLFSVLANISSNVQTKTRVGVGSTLGQVKKVYDGEVHETIDLVEGTEESVYITEGERGKLVFLLQTDRYQPVSDVTPVDGLWAVREWDPQDGYGFSGC